MSENIMIVLLMSGQLPAETLAALRATCKSFHRAITGHVPSKYTANCTAHLDGFPVRPFSRSVRRDPTSTGKLTVPL